MIIAERNEKEKGLLHKEESQCSSPFSIFLGVKMRKTSVKRVKY